VYQKELGFISLKCSHNFLSSLALRLRNNGTQIILFFGQAQPKLKFNKTWLSLALFSKNPTTHPTPTHLTAKVTKLQV
jgi:hypothetical protein